VKEGFGETIEEMVQEYPLDLIGMIPEDVQVHDFDLSGRPTIELDEGSKALKAAFEIFGKIIE
jgi:CO dehydrogenase nickel-insertion accessory protein CooC1